jgi:hypothetical protein
MTRILDTEALAERARNLGPLNGLHLAFVSLEPAGAPTHAWLDVEFHNANGLAPLPAAGSFEIVGGTRIRGGSDPGQIRVTDVQPGATANALRLRVEPVGDYSTYGLRAPLAGFDPLLRELPFRFRPGCFDLSCAPATAHHAPRAAEPVIDYLARDYDSFRHVLVTAMSQRVPGWQPTSEADLDQVLIDLIAADADLLADHQDRVANEATIATARKRVSLARHARLMDYHVHQGNQAATWLAVRVSVDATLPVNFGVWTGDRWNAPDAVIFAGESVTRCHAALNDLRLYTWGDTVTALEAGSVEADLTTVAPMTNAAADALRDVLLGPDVDRLLLQTWLNPETGTPNGCDPAARQILGLLPRDAAVPRAETIEDPVAGHFLVRVRWLAADALQRRFCFSTRCDGVRIDGVSRFHGNLARVTHGRPWRTQFRPAGAPLAGSDTSGFRGRDDATFEVTPKRGIVCALPRAPLAWRDTAPDGDTPARSTVRALVSGFTTAWTEQTDLVESRGDDTHFIVEMDEAGRGTVRFGNGVNGRALPVGATVTCDYRVGQGVAGNVGRDRLTGFDRAALPAVIDVWNPLDVTNGREPEPAARIVRRVPEAYRERQHRAVTLDDYARRAEELPEVSHARACYAWTGSWRTVRVAIDPAGGTDLAPDAARRIEAHLDAVRLIGEDLEIRPAQFVALDVELRVCAHPGYWPEDLRAVLDAEFCDGFTPDGRRGFFHPDLWTFGQAVHASQVIGRALAIDGVERVLRLSMRRWAPGRGGATSVVVIDPADLVVKPVEEIAVGDFEIIRVASDPSAIENGRITFDILGGRR